VKTLQGMFLNVIDEGQTIQLPKENKDKREKSMIDKSLHGKLKAEQHEPH
jgi:hypothetical protein